MGTDPLAIWMRVVANAAVEYKAASDPLPYAGY